MFIKFILDNREVTYEELTQKLNTLEVTDDTAEYIELYEILPDGTLVFETNCMGYIGD